MSGQKSDCSADTNNFSKQDALAALVEDGILTSQEYKACLRAVERTSSEKGFIYRDKFIAVEYRGYEKSQMVGGSGIKIHLIIENKTQLPLTIRARVMVNGIIIEKDENMVSDIPEKSKMLVSIAVFFDKLRPLDIKTVQDIEEVSFLFRCIGENYKEVNKAKKRAVIVL